MYPYILEEFARAVAQEREAESRQRRCRERRSTSKSSLRSRLAREMVHAGLHLDPGAGELAVSHPESQDA
ncbi:MAG: hypothetical protein A2148_03435 [Chloroflexi bacterium RBG_16_68_14]|nr:MAG: hypothetical protein A2148_03435 [Chloroflexi bacterium RBG_16_68_14]